MSNTRIAIINADRCKPSKCNLECKKMCPVVSQGKLCVEVTKKSKNANISEIFCIGCGICVKKCPYNAITIINLPSSLDKETIHRYSTNGFKLHRLPTPRIGQILGLVGKNGIGKSTAIKILAGQLFPNLGNLTEKTPSNSDIITYFRGSELQNYFTNLFEGKLKATIKPQYVDQISKINNTVRFWLNKKNESNESNDINNICEKLELFNVLDREIHMLSGGELQRFAIALTCIQKKNIYIFDEPSSYLDVKQRIQVAKVIRDLTNENDSIYTIVVEHDLSMLDYLSDHICVLYGTPGAYGVVTLPYTVREGINIFLDGFIPTENMRFRDESLNFKLVETADVNLLDFQKNQYSYPSMSYTINNFKLDIVGGTFNDSEVTVMLGENGTGKTTFMKLLAGFIKPDQDDVVIPELMISYKPQKIKPTMNICVNDLLNKKIRSAFTNNYFRSEIINPLGIDKLLDQIVTTLSGGELQRLAICLCLGTPANVYLIDEPSAYLDSEQRIYVSKIIKKYIMQTKKTAFVIEHDFIMATYLADKIIIFEGNPAINTTAQQPMTLLEGMNRFLKNLNITFRRDPSNFRPRINQINSQKDTEQKELGNYFFVDY